MATKKAKDKPKKPRSQKLPGMEETHLKQLDDLAIQYADIRDERMELSKSEVELKNKLLAEMKKLRKKDYVVDGIEIHLVTESETVKVKVAKPDVSDESEDIPE